MNKFLKFLDNFSIDYLLLVIFTIVISYGILEFVLTKFTYGALNV